VPVDGINVRCHLIASTMSVAALFGGAASAPSALVSLRGTLQCDTSSES
jgi:hypothetical protein